MPDDQIEITTNGKHFYKASSSYVAVVSSVIVITTFLGGMVVGFMMERTDVEYLKADNKAIQSRLDILSGHISEDRQVLTNKITSLEEQSKFISQGVAELRLSNIPKR